MIYGFSVIKDLDEKLRRLGSRTIRDGSPVETQIAFLERTINKLVDGDPVETDVPASRLLDRALDGGGEGDRVRPDTALLAKPARWVWSMANELRRS